MRVVPAWRRALHHAAFVAAAFAVVALFRFSNPTIPGTDSFRHYRHAALYAQHGVWMSAYPWLPYSVVSKWASDLWYGFNISLIPFTWLRDPIFAIKLASICETTLLMLAMYVVMRRHRMRYPWAWPFAVFFFAPATLYGMLMTRPHVLTMAFGALLLSYLVTNSWKGSLLSALALTWVHVSFFWVVPVVAGVVAVAKLVCERAIIWRSALTALLGMTVGWLLRPHPIGAAKLVWVQLVELGMARRQGVPLAFADELKPLPLGETASGFFYVLVLWVGLVGVCAAWAVGAGGGGRGHARPTVPRSPGASQEGQAEGALLWSSLALSAMFFAVTTFNTRRAVVLWVVYGVVFAAAAFSRFLDPKREEEKPFLAFDTRVIGAICAGLLLLLMVGNSANQHLLSPGMWRGDAPTVMQRPGEWLKANAKRDEIVFNVNWGDFQTLFFWDPQNRYTSGLDPIFLYSFDQELYWKAHHLQTGEAAAYTWATPDEEPRDAEDTYTVLKRDFHASYLLVRTREQRYQALRWYLENDPRFQLAFPEDGLSDEGYAVYRLAGG